MHLEQKSKRFQFCQKRHPVSELQYSILSLVGFVFGGCFKNYIYYFNPSLGKKVIVCYRTVNSIEGKTWHVTAVCRGLAMPAGLTGLRIGLRSSTPFLKASSSLCLGYWFCKHLLLATILAPTQQQQQQPVPP